MNFMNKAMFIALATLSLNAYASILPESEVFQATQRDREDSSMTEEKFNMLIDKAMVFYSPIAKKYGAELQAERLWTDNTVNAMAMRIYKWWVIFMFGGLAVQPDITDDGFQLVVCHELGHLFGGYPYDRTFMGKMVWHTIEGEADYFATHSCARELWKSEKAENAAHAATVDFYAKQLCNGAWATEEERNLCYRIANGSQSLGNFLGRKKGKPNFGTPTTKLVSKTFKKHPEPQCRLDTYIAGATCVNAFDPWKVPGISYAGYFGVFFNKKAETQAALASCHTALGDTEGTRPECWFHPRKKLSKIKDAWTPDQEPQQEDQPDAYR